jgi:chemotaxis protein CheX
MVQLLICGGLFGMSTVSEIANHPVAETLQLDAVLDLGAAERLHAQLMGLRGRPLEIDASAVERLGGLCVQVLLSAQKTWAADGGDIRLGAASPTFEQTWALFAAPPFACDPARQLGAHV